MFLMYYVVMFSLLWGTGLTSDQIICPDTFYFVIDTIDGVDNNFLVLRLNNEQVNDHDPGSKFIDFGNLEILKFLNLRGDQQNHVQPTNVWINSEKSSNSDPNTTGPLVKKGLHSKKNQNKSYQSSVQSEIYQNSPYSSSGASGNGKPFVFALDLKEHRSPPVLKQSSHPSAFMLTQKTFNSLPVFNYSSYNPNIGSPPRPYNNYPTPYRSPIQIPSHNIPLKDSSSFNIPYMHPPTQPNCILSSNVIKPSVPDLIPSVPDFYRFFGNYFGKFNTSRFNRKPSNGFPHHRKEPSLYKNDHKNMIHEQFPSFDRSNMLWNSGTSNDYKPLMNQMTINRPPPHINSFPRYKINNPSLNSAKSQKASQNHEEKPFEDLPKLISTLSGMLPPSSCVDTPTGVVCRYRTPKFEVISLNMTNPPKHHSHSRKSGHFDDNKNLSVGLMKALRDCMEGKTVTIDVGIDGNILQLLTTLVGKINADNNFARVISNINKLDSVSGARQSGDSDGMYKMKVKVSFDKNETDKPVTSNVVINEIKSGSANSNFEDHNEAGYSKMSNMEDPNISSDNVKNSSAGTSGSIIKANNVSEVVPHEGNAFIPSGSTDSVEAFVNASSYFAEETGFTRTTETSNVSADFNNFDKTGYSNRTEGLVIYVGNTTEPTSNESYLKPAINAYTTGISAVTETTTPVSVPVQDLGISDGALNKGNSKTDQANTSTTGEFVIPKNNFQKTLEATTKTT